MVDTIDHISHQAGIQVIGVGGGGCNAVAHMFHENKIDGIRYVFTNTDAQALLKLQHSIRDDAAAFLQLGEHTTQGLGAGANPEIGRKAAEEDVDRIAALLEKTDMVFLTAGEGGGTGTGATPIFAQVAREMGILTVGVVTKPFAFEGKKRSQIAEKGIEALTEHVDCYIVIPNNRLLVTFGGNTSLLSVFKAVNNVLLEAVHGITKLITQPGLINVDFADVRAVMANMGMAVMGTGISTGDMRAENAAQAAIACPLLEQDISNAQGVLVSIAGGLNVTLGEFQKVGEAVENFASKEATIVIGTVIDPEMTDELRVTIVATGLSKKTEESVSKTILGAHKPIPTIESPTLVSASLIQEPAVDYRVLDRPTVMRKQSAIHHFSSTTAKSAEPNSKQVKYLDIPNFLRKEEEGD